MRSQSLGCRWGFSDKPDRRPGVGRILTGSTLLSGKHPTPDVPISGRGPHDEAPGLCLSGTREDGPTPVANPVAGPGSAFLPSRGSRCPLCSFPSAACPNLSIPHAPPQWELAQLHGGRQSARPPGSNTKLHAPVRGIFQPPSVLLFALFINRF